jgi:dUTP pyrophosphatase
MEHKTNPKYIRFVIDDERAVLPAKAHPSDIGYDLTAIDIYKQISKSITLFETGIRVSPPEGYYLEILPRSSISKTGYMLANSVGTIDPDYTGTLKIALIKVDEELPEIELPFTRCQLVLRKVEYAEIVQVESVEKTVRGDGGFGSSDKKENISK